ncbi:MAG: hypothetical protein ABI612_15205, partial [Betaproteobacteria bacterium]
VTGGEIATPRQSLQQAREALADTNSAPIRWLRENGRYIAPTGAGDYYSAAAIYIRNWAAIQYVLGITLLTIFLFMNTVRAWAWHGGKQEFFGLNFLQGHIGPTTLPQFWGSPWLLVPAFIAALAIVPLGAAYWLTQSRQGKGLRAVRGRWFHINYPFIALMVVAGCAIWGFYASFKVLDTTPHKHAAQVALAYVYIGAILTAIVYGLSLIRAGAEGAAVARNRLSRWLGGMLLLFAVTLVFTLVDSFGQTAYAVVVAQGGGGSVAITGLVTGLLVLLVRQFASYLSADQTTKSKRIRIPTQIIGFIAGIVLALIVATLWAAIAHAIMWKGQVPRGDPGQQIIEHFAPQHRDVAVNNGVIVVADPKPLKHVETLEAPAAEFTSVALMIAFVISLLTGKTMSFLNLSSIQQFYSTRLARAYLGASNALRTGYALQYMNPDKHNGKRKARNTQDVTETVAGDDVRFDKYRPERHGGPIHLINVTINETIGGTSQLEQRDRKGLGMAIGPCGISVARVHHAIWDDDEHDGLRKLQPVAPTSGQFGVFGSGKAKERFKLKAESLTVGQWIAISGAAFTTGLGARTNLGMSLLLGLSNVRIGYWWDSGLAPKRRYKSNQPHGASLLTNVLERLFSAQVYLSDEFLARFHGPHRERWYLSDGGHYENTAVYELLRRRVPFILASDNGCDGTYLYDDLANLIRKARMDFDAEIRFLDQTELDAILKPELRKLIGTPSELQRSVWNKGDPTDNCRLQGEAYSGCHALLARVYYGDDPQACSIMLIVKPSLKGDEPLDILQYHAQHTEFPQETTLDQFFDEAQWESYRKLGTHIGDQLFAGIPDLQGWVGDLLKPKDPKDADKFARTWDRGLQRQRSLHAGGR